MKKYVLLTGATGLVGRYLIRDLLLGGHRLAVVVRASEKQSPAERIEEIAQFWESELGSPLPRPVVLEGDVSERWFGLSESAQRWVRQNCDRILHNAAILTFFGADRAGEPWRTNLRGAEYSLELCKQVGITEFHHVSTAYVCGNREDLVKEDELDVGQTFRNDYEESKFLAEKLVRDAKFIRNLTVYRPAVIAGDARTGYTSTYHGLYHHLKLISVLVRNVEPGPDGVRVTPLQLPMTGDESRNIVPVDWISAAMCRIFSSPALHGRTYHLSPREGVTPRQIVEAGYQYFNSRGVEFVGPARRDESPISNLETALKENIRMYESYETSDPRFDTTNLAKYLPDLPCPKIDQTMMHRFWRFGEQDRWGKRRAPRLVVPFWVEQFLHEELTRHHANGNGSRGKSASRTLGLNVYGPGGGQWQLDFLGNDLCSIIPGLPTEHPCVNISSADFARLVQKEERLAVDSLLACAASDSHATRSTSVRDTRRATDRAFVTSPRAAELTWATQRPQTE